MSSLDVISPNHHKFPRSSACLLTALFAIIAGYPVHVISQRRLHSSFCFSHARLLMRHTWSSNYYTLHVYVSEVPCKETFKFHITNGDWGTDWNKLAGAKMAQARNIPGTRKQQHPGASTNKRIKMYSALPSSVSADAVRCGGWGKKKPNKSKLMRFNKNPHSHSRGGCSLLGCIPWHQVPLRKRSWELQKGEQLPR